jgi:ACS family hexuronate transporter-like MFS transporter
MTLVSIVSYVDRNALAVLAPSILADLHLSMAKYGLIISAFSLCYTVSNPAWGAALDRIGLRAGMAAAVALWTVASASHALVGGILGLACARAVLGLGEGATFPGGFRTATQTLPEHMRSRGVAIAYSGGSLGAVLTPFLVTPVALAYGWRRAFVATGLLGAAWMVLWFVVAPATTAPQVPPPEGPYRTTAEPAPVDSSRASALIGTRLVAFLGLYALGGLPLGFVLYGAPLYLARALGLTQAALGTLLWIPPLGWELGYLVMGWLVDRQARRDATVVSPGVLCAVAFVGAPLAVVPLLPGVALPLAACFLATLAAGSFIILALAYATRALGVGHAGLLAGLGAGTWSALVAVAMPAFGWLFDGGRFRPAFLLAGLAQSAGVVLWFGLERTRSRSPRQ